MSDYTEKATDNQGQLTPLNKGFPQAGISQILQLPGYSVLIKVINCNIHTCLQQSRVLSPTLDLPQIYKPHLPSFQYLTISADACINLAHAIRLLLEYTETPYEDKRYRFGEAPDFDTSQWTSVKEKLGLDFPNEKLKPELIEQLPGKLKLFSQFLGDRNWFAGNKITYVDFLAYDIFDVHRIFQPKCLDQFKNLKDFMDRFEALDKISAYMKSDRFLRTPIFLRNATWGNKKK
ncbi:glutathione S-transferase Mu 4-like [Anolis carolinensis]|uniref:glutathione S-transferase Mu 4-like n=1 Tax=Anolis carolinensis TaxID=28377 RepID=UPI002F2B424F